MTIDPKSVKVIGREMGRAVLQSNAKFLRLDAASALYGPSESELKQAIYREGASRLRVMRRKRSDGKGRMILVERQEMDRWIADNFEEVPDPAGNETGPEEQSSTGPKANMTAKAGHDPTVAGAAGLSTS